PGRSPDALTPGGGNNRSAAYLILAFLGPDRLGVIVLERDLDAHRGRHREQQSDDAEQHRAADKASDDDDRVQSRRLPEHDRPDDVVDRQPERDDESDQQSRRRQAFLLQRDDADQYRRGQRSDDRHELQDTDRDGEQDRAGQREDRTEADPRDHARVDDDEKDAEQVARKRRDDLRQEVGAGVAALGGNEPDGALREPRSGDHEIRRQHQRQKQAEQRADAKLADPRQGARRDELLGRPRKRLH